MSGTLSMQALYTFTVILCLYLVKRIFSRRLPAPLPPGPKPLPILGNMLDLPMERECFTFAKWGEQWGPITSASAFGQTVIILNSPELAFGMLNQKSAIYSSRPPFNMAAGLCGWRNALVLMPYSERFRRYRRVYHQLIGSNASVSQYHPMMEGETRRFMLWLLENPDDLHMQIRKYVGGLIFRISHGYKVKDNQDPFIDLAERALTQFSIATRPGGFLVDVIPSLKLIPDWFPGAGFKKQAKIYAATLNELADRPYQFVKQQLATGDAEKSFTSSQLEGKDANPEEEFEIKWAGMSLVGGGADTTVASIHAFVLAMVLYPDVQRAAQAELDSVLGTDFERLPTFSDREHLPYIEALCKEVVRWHSIIPAGAPHCALKDDIHEGYFIPKGALVLANIWKITHDPEIYADPFKFNPSRFIASEGKPAERDIGDFGFGFGRRVCPGRIMGEASLFIACSMILSVFKISKAVDANGVVDEPVYDVRDGGSISHVKPYRCSIKPRSEKALALIRASGEV